VLTSPQFFASILDDLTVRVSEAFRDPGFYRAFREKVVPLLHTYPLLKIWHAGCASGEEVYSLAILLMEEALYERAQIYATDMSPKALELARAGVYEAADAEKFARNYLASGGRQQFGDYCSSAYGKVVVRENLRQNIVFFQHDLACDHSLGEMHVVFCRNVMIYFGSELRERALGLFGECLEHGGFLCLGKNEGLPADGVHRFSELVPGERIYRKRAA